MRSGGLIGKSIIYHFSQFINTGTTEKHRYLSRQYLFLKPKLYICKKLILENTIEQYDKVILNAREIFIHKNTDYGSSWRILRPTSLTDQIFIKAKRIRSIQETGLNKVNESIEGEFIAIINYGLMALIQLSYPPKEEDVQLEIELCLKYYEKFAAETKNLMLNKNHDYGEAWRDMRVSSITDLILVKLQRIKQIEENDGKTIVSEGLDSNYQDIINYAVFASILLEEKKH
jgi:hypothetical protein